MGRQDGEVHAVEAVLQPLRLRPFAFTTRASSSRPAAHRHSGQAAGNANAGNALASCGTQSFYPRRAESQHGQSHRMCGSGSGTPRQKGRLSNCRMACPVALHAVHLAPASSQRRMLCSPFCGSHLQARVARLTVHRSALAPEGIRPVSLQLPKCPETLALTPVYIKGCFATFVNIFSK